MPLCLTFTFTIVVTNAMNPVEYKRKVLELTQVLAFAWQDFDETDEAYILMDESFTDLIKFMCLNKIDGEDDE